MLRTCEIPLLFGANTGRIWGLSLPFYHSVACNSGLTPADYRWWNKLLLDWAHKE